MPGTADEIAAYLENPTAVVPTIASLGLVRAVSLFTSPFPAAWTADVGACIDVYGGKPNTRGGGATGAPRTPLGEHPFFHVFVRGGRDQDDATRALANAIYKALDDLGPVTLSGVLYRDVHSPDGEPKFHGRDENQRPVYVISFEASKNRS